jgi:hypothetical protein
MASLGSQVQGRAAPHVFGMHISAFGQEQLHNIQAALLCCEVERRPVLGSA